MENEWNLYYVSAADERHYWLMRGPFGTHEEALAVVDETRRKASQLDPRSDFMAWGTCRKPSDLVRNDAGKMNQYFVTQLLKV